VIENKVMSVLFDENELFCAGDMYSTESFPVFPVSTGFQYFTVNPLGGKQLGNTRETFPTRKDSNVSVFRNFVFEMDEIELHEQEQLLNSIDIPFSSIIYSGGKSLHAIISLENPLELAPGERESINAYKAVWKSIAAYIDLYAAEIGLVGPGVSVVDPSCSNPSRFTRYPNSYREDKGKVQDVKHVGQRINSEVFNSLLKKCPDFKAAKVFKKQLPKDFSHTKMEFLRKVGRGCLTQLKYAPRAASSGMYNYAYETVTWCIDEGKPTKDLMIELMEEYFIKRVKAAGYYDPECKNVYRAIEDAYKEKLGEYYV
jgi:hypothetical protein